MALRNKKTAPVTEPEIEGTNSQAAENKPYMVFNTREEFEDAIADMAQQKETAPLQEMTPPKAASPQESAPNERDRMAELWQRDARMLSIIVPDFNLEAALGNEVFRNALVSGASVFEAYAAMSRPAGVRRNEIFQNAQSGIRGTGDAQLNPAKLNSRDFKEYIDNIRSR